MATGRRLTLAGLMLLACSVDKLDYRTIGEDGCPASLAQCKGGGGESGNRENDSAGAAGVPTSAGGDGGGDRGASAGETTETPGGSAGESGVAGTSGVRPSQGGRASGGEVASGGGSAGSGAVEERSGGRNSAGGETGLAGEAGRAGAPSTPECLTDSDCPAIATEPSGCAVARCAPDSCHYEPRDADGDRYPTDTCVSLEPDVVITPGTDCNDADRTINPDAWDGPEQDGVPDGCNDDSDNDCNGRMDDGVRTSDGATCTCVPDDVVRCALTATGLVVEFPMLGDDGQPLGACKMGEQLCLDNGTWGDCEGVVGPRPEICDSLDNDCDGKMDEDASDTRTFSYDADGDHHAAPWANPVRLCFPPSAAPEACTARQTKCPPEAWTPDILPQDDCDDENPTRYAGAPERCNRIDDDCGNTDGSAEELAEDADNDGYTSSTYRLCSGGFPQTDCSDGNAKVHPGQLEFFVDGYCLSAETPIWCFERDQCAAIDTCTDSIGQKWGDASHDYDCNGVEEPPEPTLTQIIAYGDACAAASTADNCLSASAPMYPAEEGVCGMLTDHKKCKAATGECAYATVFAKLACR